MGLKIEDRPYNINLLDLGGAVLSLLVAGWTIYQFYKSTKLKK